MHTWHDPSIGIHPSEHINQKGEKRRVEGKIRGKGIRNGKERRGDRRRVTVSPICSIDLKKSHSSMIKI